MAHPIAFEPEPVDPHVELMRRVEEAPREHAEALLVAWDLLQTAHDQGLLDLAVGLMGGRDTIAKHLAEGAVMPETIAMMRNLIALGRILGSFDPDVLHRLSRNLAESERAQEAKEAHRAQAQPPGTKLQLQFVSPEKRNPKPPSLWQLLKRAGSEDGRRGIAFAIDWVAALGRALESGK
jgi:uncharacterized protein YjgD (DUF1641 family)